MRDLEGELDACGGAAAPPSAAGPDGTLWFLSNNTDGRGNPISGDDHLYQVRLVPLEEG